MTWDLKRFEKKTYFQRITNLWVFYGLQNLISWLISCIKLVDDICTGSFQNGWWTPTIVQWLSSHIVLFRGSHTYDRFPGRVVTGSQSTLGKFWPPESTHQTFPGHYLLHPDLCQLFCQFSGDLCLPSRERAENSCKYNFNLIHNQRINHWVFKREL